MSRPAPRNALPGWRGVLGIDEAGRGAWAGPVVAGAVLLKRPVSGLTDSKLLSRRARERILSDLIDSGAWFGVGWAMPAEVDELGLSAAVRLAMTRASRGAPESKLLLIDGNVNYLPELPNARAVIKADLLHPAASAASIVAKVHRDRYMTLLHHSLPRYGFDRHVGYGTDAHLAALKLHGASAAHRRSYRPLRDL